MSKQDKKPTKLEVAVANMVEVFMQKKGAKGKLTKAQFLALLKEELPSYVEATGECDDEIFKDVDMDEDGLVDFPEFSTMIAMYAWLNYETLQGFLKMFAGPDIAICPPVVLPDGPEPCVLKVKK